MKKLAYILICYIGSVIQTGNLFSSSTLIMFIGCYFLCPIIIVGIMYFLKYGEGIKLVKPFLPAFFFKLSFVKPILNLSNKRDRTSELSNEAIEIISKITSKSYYKNPDKKKKITFNERISEKLKKQLIDNLNSIVDLKPYEFYYIISDTSLMEYVSNLIKGQEATNTLSNKNLIVFEWLKLPSDLDTKYNHALKEYKKIWSSSTFIPSE